MSLANWWKRSGTRLIPINSTDITSLSFHPASLMDKHTGLPLPYRKLPLARGSRYPLVIRLAERGMDKRYMGVHADIIASTYFLISRYEEMVRRGLRDEHGRFPGKESLPYRAGSCIVRSWMNIACCFIVGCANPGYVYPSKKAKSGRSTSRTT